jgi:hypothetical protein
MCITKLFICSSVDWENVWIDMCRLIKPEFLSSICDSIRSSLQPTTITNTTTTTTTTMMMKKIENKTDKQFVSILCLQQRSGDATVLQSFLDKIEASQLQNIDFIVLPEGL